MKHQDPYIKDMVKNSQGLPAILHATVVSTKHAVREVIADVGPKIGRFGKLD